MISDLALRIFDIRNPILKNDFEQFYALMKSSFPKEERRSCAEFKALAKSSAYYKIYSLFKEGSLIAFFTVWEFTGFRFGDHFAVAPQIRNSGIGSMLLSQILNESSRPFILEVELPENEMAARRLNFYLRNGFKLNNFPYLLPPMQEGCKPLPMHILSYPEKLSENEFKNVRDMLYKIVYNGKAAHN